MPKNEHTPIDYTGRDYSAIRIALEQFAKRYYPDSYKDFNAASFGSLMLDAVSYIGDQISFYIDYQATESFIDTAVETENVLRHAESLGWKGEYNHSTSGYCDFYVIVPSKTSGTGPDLNYAPILKANSTLLLGKVPFILSEDIDFSLSTNEVVVARTNDATGGPVSYAIKATGPVISGEFRRVRKRTGGYEKFKRIAVRDSALVEIISVVDLAGNVYYEVESLDQNTIYTPVRNVDQSSIATVKHILRPTIVPRRYVKLRSKTAGCILQFGYGSDKNTTIADPSNIVFKSYGKDYISDTSFAPEKLLQTDKYGVCPEDTELTIIYRITPTNSSVASKAPGTLRSANFWFMNSNDLDGSKMRAVRSSVECTNSEPIVGSVGKKRVSEIKQIAKGIFTRQKRAVTLKDYKSMIYSMPSSFGSIYKCSILQDKDSFKRNLNVYVLTRDRTGNYASCSDILKNNLKTWINEYKMINDTVDIMDAKVVNIGVDYLVSIDETADPIKMKRQCDSAVSRICSRAYEIGQDFPIADIWSTLNSISGVTDVKDVKITKPTGARYSDIKFNIQANTSATGKFLLCPLNVAFETKFPSKDVRGKFV